MAETCPASRWEFSDEVDPVRYYDAGWVCMDCGYWIPVWEDPSKDGEHEAEQPEEEG